MKFRDEEILARKQLRATSEVLYFSRLSRKRFGSEGNRESECVSECFKVSPLRNT